MNRKLAILASALLIVVIFLTLFLTHNYDIYRNPNPPFYVGVEYAYGYNNETAQIQLAEVKALVDKVKDYTNLFVIGSLGLTFDREALTEACDYIVNANLNFIILFTGLPEYSFERLGEKSYNTTIWMIEAKAR